MKKKFDIEVVDNVKSNGVIEVSGFSSKISKEMLEMYFESKRSGGNLNAIKDSMIVDEGIAHLTFTDPEG